MPDASDILKDPSETLREILSCRLDVESPALRRGAHPDLLEAVNALERLEHLHRHILSGGDLPAQWRGEGTAVGALLGEVADLRKAAADWSLDLQQQAVAQLERADDLRRGSSAVTGEG